MMKTFSTLLFTVAAAIAGAAQAQTLAQNAPAAPHYYIGLGAVHATGSSDTSPKLFGGVDLDNNVGIEAGYVHFGSHDGHDYFADTNYDWSDKAYGAYLAGKYTVPLGERFAAYGKIGLAYSNGESETRANGVSLYRDKSSDTGAYGALGAQYKLTEKVALNAEFEHMGRTIGNVWSVGLKVGF
jgi:opacity protein-like surface antigen